LRIVKSKDRKAKTLKTFSSFAILFNVLGFKMVRPIHFDDEFRGWSIEVDDVMCDRFLAVKLNTKNLLAAKTGPKPALCVGHTPA